LTLIEVVMIRMNYAAAIDFLYNLRLFGTKLGLENTFRLAELCGNPQKDLRFIHVAGTNGKGSTCAMLESIYRSAGMKVGLFTSPHLVSFTERTQVNRSAIPEPDVTLLTEHLIKIVQGENGHADMAEWHFKPTFFEFVTIMALVYFREQHCDLVIWETGLGGRLDATNIVMPLACIITNIQRDHEKWLGNTLASIATEKAGIIKPGVPIITGTDNKEALDVIRQTAKSAAAPLKIVPQRYRGEISLFGDHQKNNAALAIETVQVLQSQIPVPEQTVDTGLRSVFWPGRFQEIRTESGGLVILDGAHNPDGIRVLIKALQIRFPGQRFCFVLGMLKDKAWEQMCETLLPLAEALFISRIYTERSSDPEIVKAFCQKISSQTQVDVCESLHDALTQSRKYPATVVTGSLLFIGEAMQELGLSATVSPKETALNEWDATGHALATR
jgi:dihydrofolate synthase/folylpolyglutamate synthase